MKPIKNTLRKLAQGYPYTRRFLAERFRKKVTERCRTLGVGARFGSKLEFQKHLDIMEINLGHAIYGETLAKDFEIHFSTVTPEKINGCNVVDYSATRVHTLKNGLSYEFTSWPERDLSCARSSSRWTPAFPSFLFSAAS